MACSTINSRINDVLWLFSNAVVRAASAEYVKFVAVVMMT